MQVLRDAVRGYGIVKRLPPSLLTHIFSFCRECTAVLHELLLHRIESEHSSCICTDGKVLIICSEVCKEWRELCQSEDLWELVRADSVAV